MILRQKFLLEPSKQNKKSPKRGFVRKLLLRRILIFDTTVVCRQRKKRMSTWERENKLSKANLLYLKTFIATAD